MGSRSFLCNCKLEAEESFLLDPLATCLDSPTQFKMYFTVNLFFVIFFDKWTESVMPAVNLDITENEKMLPLALQDLSIYTPKCLDKPKHLRDIITRFKNK